MTKQPRLQLIHSARVIAPKALNQFEKRSIADRCLIHGASRSTLAREYGVQRRDIDEICDAARFEDGVRVGRNQARFAPPMRRAA